MNAEYIDENLLRYATPKQRQKLEAVRDHGSVMKAARKLGMHHAAISCALASVKAKAAMGGYAPGHGMTHEAPDPFVVKGVSTYYDKDGDVRGQWVKTQLDGDKVQTAVKAFVDSIVEEARGKSPKIAAPKFPRDDLLTVYPIGDPHIGMYAWAAEAGEDFDVVIAEKIMKGAVERLIVATPSTKTAIIAPLGDYFHMDDQTNRTPAHHNQLDVDSRYPKVVSVGVKILRHIILCALTHHEKVIVRVEPGNHDPHSHWVVRYTMAAYFENNPRVEVDMTPSKFWFYRFGKVLIGTCHGDTAKHKMLPGIMAADRPEDWGVTKHRYWYTGDIHHKEVSEFPGVTCESFRTLSPRDAWATAQGFRSGRDMCAIVLHNEHGEVERHRCDIGMVVE
jgi:hypothetical protein